MPAPEIKRCSDSNCQSNLVAIEKYFESQFQRLEGIMNERDNRYQERFLAQQEGIKVGLAAVKELNSVVAEAAKEAVIKAEQAQAGINIRGNEFRQSLDDYTKLMMSRTESLTLHKATDDKIEARSVVIDSKIDEIKKDIIKLREFQSNYGGGEKKEKEKREQSNWNIGLIVLLVSNLVAIGISIAALLK
jgi:phosphopantetheinyl transferase (holo-ACP synthase)